MSILNRSYSSNGAGRAIGGGPYQNLSAIYPLLVIVHGSGASTWGLFQAAIGSTSGLGTNPFQELPCNGDVIHDTAFFFVPPLWYYQVTGAPNLNWWSEYQILTGVLNGGADLGPSGSNTRALNTTYTNSSANGIVVLAIVSTTTVGDLVSGSSNSANPYLVDMDGGGTVPHNYDTQTSKLFVPGGATYQLASTGTLVRWREYDFGCPFTDPGDQSTRFAIGNTTQNTGTAPWLVEIPASFTSTGFGGGIDITTDSSNPPTTITSSQWKRGFGKDATGVGIVMPGEWITPAFGATSGGTLVNIGSPRLYSLGGIPFASAPIMCYQSP